VPLILNRDEGRGIDRLVCVIDEEGIADADSVVVRKPFGVKLT